ncbi:MAG: deoxyuridine 5'-triphosphate nucleotidohydrolase [Eubacteriales bacterium]|nr:deoxyuridine 5'-triphosphate nucleotidohydrolase [Eubacteriales bacterium]
MEKVTLKIKYHTDAIEKLAYIDGKSDWIDLRAAKRYELKKGDWQLIDLGVSIALPEGYEAHVVPRSSTYRTWGLLQTNSCGVIDNTYSGDGDVWMVPMLATRDTVVEVGDRICQFRIMKNQPQIVFDEVEHLDGINRGGFGTTGRK